MTDFMSLNPHIDPLSLIKQARPSKHSKGGSDEKMSQTALDFEAMLMSQMFQTMRKTIEPSGLFGYNQSERSTYEYLLDQAMFQNAAADGQTWGLAERLEEAWKLLQEKIESPMDGPPDIPLSHRGDQPARERMADVANPQVEEISNRIVGYLK